MSETSDHGIETYVQRWPDSSLLGARCAGNQRTLLESGLLRAFGWVCVGDSCEWWMVIGESRKFVFVWKPKRGRWLKRDTWMLRDCSEEVRKTHTLFPGEVSATFSGGENFE